MAKQQCLRVVPMKHTWTLKTRPKGNEKCGRCGLIREIVGYRKVRGKKWTIYWWYRGNKNVGEGPLMLDMPKCFDPGEKL